jgi:hypothetical protein
MLDHDSCPATKNGTKGRGFCIAVMPRHSENPSPLGGVDRHIPALFPDSSLRPRLTFTTLVCIMCDHDLGRYRDRRYCRAVVFAAVDGLIISHPLPKKNHRAPPQPLPGRCSSGSKSPMIGSSIASGPKLFINSAPSALPTPIG